MRGCLTEAMFKRPRKRFAIFETCIERNVCDEAVFHKDQLIARAPKTQQLNITIHRHTHMFRELTLEMKSRKVRHSSEFLDSERFFQIVFNIVKNTAESFRVERSVVFYGFSHGENFSDNEGDKPD